MIDKAIGFGAAFDWITPLATLVQDYRNRPSVGYSVAVDGGWSADAISDLLKAYGIKHWGVSIFQDTILFRLRLGQAEFAQYLFHQNGIPYSGGANVRADRERKHRSERPGKCYGKSVPAEVATDTRQRSLGGILDDSIHSINQFTRKLPGG